MPYEPGDLVYARTGDYEGGVGYVVSKQEASRVGGDESIYQVMFSENGRGVFDDLLESELNPVEVVDDGDEDEEEVETPSFGMSQEEFLRHTEYLMTKALDRIAITGPESAFFGFQEFEGKDAKEILVELLVKIEENMALLSQAHILTSRIAIALQTLEGQ